MTITLNPAETLHVELEDSEMYLTLRSPGCSSIPMRTVEAAVEFTMPQLSVVERIHMSREILGQIVAHLTETETNQTNN